VPFIVVYDANALYGNTLRDLLIRIAQTGLVQAKWTDRILDEALAGVRKRHPDLPPERLARLRELMIQAVPDCIIRGHEPPIDGLQLRDPDDRHVLAAAIKAGAQVIVTWDKDFTSDALAPWNIEAKTPDDFVRDQIDIADRMIWGVRPADRQLTLQSARDGRGSARSVGAASALRPFVAALGSTGLT